MPTGKAGKCVYPRNEGDVSVYAPADKRKTPADKRKLASGKRKTPAGKEKGGCIYVCE